MRYVRTLIAAPVERHSCEGCAVCPPADPQSGPLRPDATRVPLALHVGDWDDPGWRHPDGAAGS